MDTAADTASTLRQETLRLSESRYRRLFETAQDGILLLNADSAQIEDVNPFLMKMLGYSHTEFLGRKLWEVGAFADIAQSKQMFAELQTRGYVRYHHLPLKTSTGTRVDVEFVSNSYDCEGVKVIQCNVRDITDRIAAEAHARLRTRLYKALSECNKAIVDCSSEQELFPRICRIAVLLGGMKMAWIGMTDAEPSTVRVAASFGDKAEYLKDIRITLQGDSASGRGPTATAIRDNRPMWIDNSALDPAGAPWRERRERAGFAASAALPLRRGGVVVGALSVYSGEANPFDATTRDLLLEIATDISFALDGFARDGHRRRTEAALIESEAQLNYTEEVSQTGGWRFDLRDRTSRRTREHDRIFGYDVPPARWDRGTFLEHVLPEDRPQVERNFREFATQRAPLDFECRIRRADGDLRWIRIVAAQLADDPGVARQVSGIVQDITERHRVAQVLSASQQRLQGVLTSAMDAIVTADERGAVVLSNPAAEKMFGYTSLELRGRNLELLMPERFRAAHAGQVAKFGASGITNRYVGALSPVRALRRSGEEFPIEVAISVDRSTGRPLYTAIIRDITERQHAETRIRYLNRVFAVLSGINSLIVRARSREQLFVEACNIAVKIGGFRMASIGVIAAGAKHIELVASAGKDDELLAADRACLAAPESADGTMMARAIRAGEPVVSNDSQNDAQVRLGGKYAERGVRSIAVLPLIVAHKAIGAMAMYAGETEFFHAEELKLLVELAGDIGFAIDHLDQQGRLEYLAYFDELTELANRTLFLERVTRHMRSAAEGRHRFAALIIDLERFRNINDSLGRAAGDSILQQVAQWLTRAAGDADLLARIGPDQFALAMASVKNDDDVGRHVGALMDAFLLHPFHVNDAAFRIAAKVGVALFPEHGGDADTLVRHAEAALRKAKAQGDRYLFYTQKMTEAVAGKLKLETQLREALEKKEFVLHYQPKVNLASGVVTGAEALIRWNDPQSGLVAPGRFIPVLEETGLIYDVGRWALRTAIADYLRWQAAGLAAVRIAVNVSPLQLRDRGFVAEVGQSIGGDAHAAAGLELEITESLIMEDVRQNIDVLRTIRAMGVSIAIDDFGTGFSSLSYLAKLPVDTLKIDRSFVQDMCDGPEALSLVSTVISLAHGMKLKVVAEGVETEQQSGLLRSLGCDEMQGFLFSRPLPRETFEARFLAPPTPT